MSITNDEAMDSVRDAMTYIDTVLPYDIKEANDLVLRLRGTVDWIENKVDGDWEDEGTQEVD
jgi:hypothetical protein